MSLLGQHLIKCLKSHGVDTMFGVPGDYILNLYHQFEKEFNVVNTTDEQGAGFAADGYARCSSNKLGVVVATYCVGGFKLANAIAGAHAEKSPVLFITGSPGLKERTSGMKLHHMVGSFSTQYNVFKNITAHAVVIDNPVTAIQEIENVIALIKHYSLPGYLEIPRDMIDVDVSHNIFLQGNPDVAESDEEILNAAVARSLEMLQESKNPVILAGCEVSRFDLGGDVLRFAEAHNIPIAATPLSKSVVDETHPLFFGIYSGEYSPDHVRERVESSDCLIKLGVFLTDMNLGFEPPRTPKSNEIFCTTNEVRVKLSNYKSVVFQDFMKRFLESFVDKKRPIHIPNIKNEPFESTDEKITSQRLFQKIDSVLSKNITVVADVGDSLFGAMELTVHDKNQFLASAFYTSMGFAVPAAIGSYFATDKRPLVIVGDGAFQMTGMEVSTMLANDIPAIVVVLNNKGYLTERFLGYDGKFNDVHLWDFHKITEVIRGGEGFLVETEKELDNAFDKSLASNRLCIINVVLDKLDASVALKRMTENLKKKVVS